MKEDKAINIVSIILYYIITCGIFLFVAGYAIVNGIIGDFSPLLFIFCYAVIPLIFLTLPFIYKHFLNENNITSIMYSFATIIFYIGIVLNGIKFCITTYMSTFTSEKWEKHEYLRYLMLNDLIKKYNFKGMTRDEVYNLLGDNIPEENVVSYHVKTEWLEVYYFVIHFDQNDIVIGINMDH